MHVCFSNLKSQRNAGCNLFHEEPPHKTNHTFCSSRISGNKHSPQAEIESHVKCTLEDSAQTLRVRHWLCPHEHRLTLRQHRYTGCSHHLLAANTATLQPAPIKPQANYQLTGSAGWNNTPNCTNDTESTQAQLGVHCRQKPGRTLNN